MRLVDADTYARYTGDRDTDADTVDEALDEATALLEERLGRVLSIGSRTERLQVSRAAWSGDHVVYPACVPLQSTDNGTIVGDAITGVSVDGGLFAVGDWATVTYLGGFTPDTLPRAIARDLSACAHQLIETTAPASAVETDAPPGATAVKVGDLSISYATGETGSVATTATGFAWSQDTLRWRRRTL